MKRTAASSHHIRGAGIGGIQKVMNDGSSYLDGMMLCIFKGVRDSFFKMIEQKSKYLIWLETLHREYTERTNITLFGQQAMLIKLLADMYEVRCRFEKILGKLQSEAFVLEDEDVKYEEWYNPEKWKIADNSLHIEDMIETFNIKQGNPLPQTYSNILITPFGENANFDNDRFRNVVSSLFVLNTIVDEQKMEVALDGELKKLQKLLLDISNAKKRKKEPEEYAVFFDAERLKYRKSFITKSKLLAEHRNWKDRNYDDDYKEALKERRVELLLELFDSGFLDDLKVRSHRRPEDLLGFKKYEFEKWNGREEDAIRYFATLCKICPFRDDMIDFSDHAKIGRYILDEHIEPPMVNAFLRVMELILLVQKEMRTIDDPDYVEDEDQSPAEAFIEKVKRILLLMEDENGTTLKLTGRGDRGMTYKFEVRGKALGEVLDDVLVNKEEYVKSYLEGATKETATQLKYVCPFLGYILDTHLYSTDKLQKKDLAPMFEHEYGKTSAVSKMKHKTLSNEAENFFKIVEETMKKHLEASKTSTLK